MAPTLPLAAEIPWELERYRVGKHSPGTMKVVALGPEVRRSATKTVQLGEVAQTEIEEELAEYIERQQPPSVI